MTFPPKIRLPRDRVLLPLSLLLITRLAVGLLYSLSVPIWEADNEDSHFAYARYLAQNRTLLQADDPQAQLIFEKMQPPLYYILMAAVITPFRWEGNFETPERNPYMYTGVAGVNYALHPPALEGQALTTALAVGLMRTAGVLLTTVSVLFVFLSAQHLWPGRRSQVWAATCLYAFWPQLLLTGGMVTNDTLLISLSAIFLYLALTLNTHGSRGRRWLLLGLVLGAALLTKLNGLALLPAAILTLLLDLRQTHLSWRRMGLALFGISAVVALALWLLSSQTLVTDHLYTSMGINAFLSLLSSPGNLLAYLDIVAATFQFQFSTFLASYGWGNIETYAWLHELWPIVFGLAAVGWAVAVGLRSARHRRAAYLLLWTQALSHVALTTALAVSRADPIVPGRYLLPALPAIVLLLFEGWQMLVSPRWHSKMWQVVSLGIVLIGWSIPFETLAPAYAHPLPASAAQLKAITPVNAIFDHQIELMGYAPAQPATPGQDLSLTLCWQALQPVEKNYTILLEIVGPDGQGYGRLRTFPDGGNYATSFWKVNTPFCEPYTLEVGTGLPAPSVAKVMVKLFNQDLYQTLPVTELGGQPVNEPLEPANVLIKVRSAATVASLKAPTHATAYRFGNELILRGYDTELITGAQAGLRVVLHWEANAKIPANYVVFVHLRDTPAHAYVQDDHEPRGGWYPTAWWTPGETVQDEHTLYLPEGVAPPLDLYVGLYNPATNTRVPVFDAQGTPVNHDEVILMQNINLP